MQTDQRLVFHRPIQVGDRLFCDVYLESFRQVAGSDIIVTKNIITDQNDEAVVTTWTTLVARTGGESGREHRPRGQGRDDACRFVNSPT